MFYNLCKVHDLPFSLFLNLMLFSRRNNKIEQGESTLRSAENEMYFHVISRRAISDGFGVCQISTTGRWITSCIVHSQRKFSIVKFSENFLNNLKECFILEVLLLSKKKKKKNINVKKRKCVASAMYSLKRENVSLI